MELCNWYQLCNQMLTRGALAMTSHFQEHAKVRVPQVLFQTTIRVTRTPNSQSIAKVNTDLSTLYSEKQIMLVMCNSSQPKSKGWPSFGVASANDVERAWTYGWEIHMVHVGWSWGRREQGRRGPQRASPPCTVIFWHRILIQNLLLCHFEGTFVKLEDKYFIYQFVSLTQGFKIFR